MTEFLKRRHDTTDGDVIGSDLSSTNVGVVGLWISVVVALVIFVLPIILTRRARRRAHKEPIDGNRK